MAEKGSHLVFTAVAATVAAVAAVAAVASAISVAHHDDTAAADESTSW